MQPLDPDRIIATALPRHDVHREWQTTQPHAPVGGSFFGERLARALRPEHLLAIVADPSQPSLFDDELSTAETILTDIRSDGDEFTLRHKDH